MKSKHIIASLLAAVSFSAFGATQSFDVADLTGEANTFFSTKNVGALFSGGFDTIKFNLAPGTYDVVLNLFSTRIKFDAQTNLNGVYGSATDQGVKIHFFGLEGVATTPLVLNVYGTPLTPATGPYSYKGDLYVSAVPEPETYGMLMAGLGLVGFVARRKAAKKAV